MNEALRPDSVTAVIIDVVNRSHRSHASIARSIGISESTMHRKMTCKSGFTVVDAFRIMATLRTTFSAELRRANV